VIDLRSDFCAPPTDEMWAAMRSGGEETVAKLELTVAFELGKEAGVFCPTCTAANLAALLALGERGGGAVVEAGSHIHLAEGGGISELAGLLPVSVATTDGRLSPDEVEAAVVTRQAVLVCLENTHTRAGGTVLDAGATAALAHAAHKHGARVHLDGARLVNAAAALAVDVGELTAPVDTVAVSLNKSLCAPYGAVLAGDAATIGAAREHLHRPGAGTVHKAGVLAAAGLVAWESMRSRLGEDHERARRLAELLDLPPPETNIVMTRLPASALPALEQHGVLAFAPGGGNVRLVTHRGISDDDVERAAAAAEATGESLRDDPGP
jgi:threonine aldolase